jgi:hypothetical protein
MLGHLQDGSVSATAIQQQVDKILRSDEFSGSEVLRNLLSFLAAHSIDRPGEVVKEYELATAVLGKAEGFDPRLDSAVRVHAARLRSKLAEYYMSHGTDDPLLIEVPKGSYQVVWRYRGLETIVQAPIPKETPSAAGRLPPVRNGLRGDSRPRPYSAYPLESGCPPGRPESRRWSRNSGSHFSNRRRLLSLCFQITASSVRPLPAFAGSARGLIRPPTATTLIRVPAP